VLLKEYSDDAASSANATAQTESMNQMADATKKLAESITKEAASGIQ
jgi:hypothetical protein